MKKRKRDILSTRRYLKKDKITKKVAGKWWGKPERGGGWGERKRVDKIGERKERWQPQKNGEKWNWVKDGEKTNLDKCRRKNGAENKGRKACGKKWKRGKKEDRETKNIEKRC